MAGREGRARVALGLAIAGVLLAGCSGTSNTFSASQDDGSLPTIGDRFNQLFGLLHEDFRG